MEKGEKYMETFNANILKEEEKYYIQIVGDDEKFNVKIPISEDEPNAVKSAFNLLIQRLKEGPYNIAMPEVKEDLFSQVANEYIKHLNKEIEDVLGEMRHYNLVE